MPAARTASALALAAALAAPARADGPRPLERDLRIDLPLTAVAATAWIGTELAKPRLAPEGCRWCDPGPLDAAARDAVVWSEPRTARRISDGFAFGLLPAGVLAHQLLAARAEGDLASGWTDLLVVAEAAALAADLNQLVKFSVGRERPFVHHAPAGRAREPDDDLSFYSGHTSLAFSLAASAGMVSTLRGYRSAPWVWGAGLTAAAGVGWLRMGGDMHWLSDVLVGAVVGTAVGAGLPWLLHREGSGALGPGAKPTPAMAAIAFPF